MRLLSFMCLFWPVLTILAGQCRCPGKPTKGTVQPNKSAYNEGERVTYTCDQGYYFKKDSQFLNSAQRTCLDTGLWSGTIPACDYDDIMYNAHNITPVGLNNTTDGRDDTCAPVKLATSSNKNPPKTSVTAFIERGIVGSFQILVLFDQIVLGLLNERNMSVQVDAKRCSALIPESGISKFSSICSITHDSDTHKVKLTFSTWSQQESSVSLCSFQGLQLTEPDCEELECPAYGTVNRTSHGFSSYTCEEGYELNGEPQRECVFGQHPSKFFWNGTAPVCDPKIYTDTNGSIRTADTNGINVVPHLPVSILGRQCGCPGQPDKGSWDVNKDHYDVGDHVICQCDSGYYFKHDSQFLKAAQRTCQETGLWNGTLPACDYYDVIRDATPEDIRNFAGIWHDDNCNYNKTVTTTNTTPKTVEITVQFNRFYNGPIQILVTLAKQSFVETNMSVQMDANQCSLPTSSSTSKTSKFSCTCNITDKGVEQHTVSLTFSASHTVNVVICYFKMMVIADIDCEEPECPANGMVSRSTLPDIATYTCEEGYVMNGTRERHCVSRRNQEGRHFWAVPAPVCTPKRHTDAKPCVPPIINASTCWALIIIAVIMTIFNILYCFVRYRRKKLKTTRKRPPFMNAQHIYQNQAMRM